MSKTPPPAPTAAPVPAPPIENVKMYIEMTGETAQNKLVEALADIAEAAERALKSAQKGEMPTNLGTFANLVATMHRQAGMCEVARVVKTLANA